MKTLKLALLATGAVGAVAAGGIAYATVSNNSPATSAKLPDAKSVVQHGPAVPNSLPNSVPTCLPKVAKKLPKVSKHLPKAPNAGQLPQVPGTDQLPQVPGTNQLPQVPNAGQLPQAPSVPHNLPTCAPKLPSAPTGNLPAAPAAKPDLPNVPSVASCDAAPPAIRMANGRAKDFTLPNGMHLAFAHAHSVMIDGRRACGMVEKFVGSAGQWFTVDRVSTPPQATVQDVARALKLPDTGKIVSIGGMNAWQSPLNNGSMWISDKGYALSVDGSPAMAAELPAIVSQLRKNA